MTSWMINGLPEINIWSRNFLCVFEKEYGFFAEHGKNTKIFADLGFLYLFIILFWNLFISGRFNDSFVVAFNLVLLVIDVFFSKKI